MTDLTKYKEIVAALEEILGFFKGYDALNHLPEWFWEQEKSGLDFDRYQGNFSITNVELALPVTAYPAIAGEDG